ncbi:MAG TPA: hypothetical protein VIZ65_06720 [Cellvibrionaceae bacterium]
METAQLALGLVFSSIGLSYFIYGKKRSNMVVRYAGVALMVYPYFIQGTIFTIVVGLALMVFPKLHDRFFN